MTTGHCRALLCALLIPLAAPAQEPEPQEERGAFWKKFEQEVDRFVLSMTGEYIGDDLEFPFDDSAATRIVISARHHDRGGDDCRTRLPEPGTSR
jgi:hypothetical protein